MASVKDLGNGKYRIHVCNGFRADGKVNRSSKVVTAKSARDAERQAQAIEVDFKRTSVDSVSDMKIKTFRDLVSVWRENGTNSLVEKTLIDWNDKLATYILPVLGSLKIEDIKPIHVDRYLSSLREDGIRRDKCSDGTKKSGGFSEQTIKHHYTIINRMFNYGVKKQLINNNPCIAVDKPRVLEQKSRFYDNEQMNKLFKFIDGEIKEFENNPCIDSVSCNWKKKLTPLEQYAVNRFEKYMYSTYTHLSYETGCRRNEMCGMNFSDFDYKNLQISVYKGSHYSSKSGVYTQPHLKNKLEGVRGVKMTEKQLNRVMEYKKIMDETRAIMGDRWVYSDRLFIATVGGSRTPAGEPINPTTVSQWFVRKIKQYKLEDLSLHGLRHSCASLLLNKGKPSKAVGDRLGDSAQTIDRIYAHVFKSTEKEVAECFDE